MVQGAKILIVEDEKPIAKALELKLGKAGMEVVSVDNGLDALAILTKQPFDLILLDLIVPQGDGFTVLNFLKERGNKTPVVIWSNLGQQEDIRRAKDLGAVAYLIKFDTSLAEVVDLASKLLQERAAWGAPKSIQPSKSPESQGLTFN